MTYTKTESAASDLPEHITQFNELTHKLDVAVRAKNQEEIENANAQLNDFFGVLKPEQQEEIRMFLLQQELGRRITSYRNATRSSLHKIMAKAADITKSGALAIPGIAAGTAKLVFETVGLTVVAAAEAIGHTGVAAAKAGKRISQAWNSAA